MTTRVDEFEIDVTGERFAAAVASARELIVGLSARVDLLPAAAAKTVFGSLTALREDLARVEVAVAAQFVKLGAPKMAGARSTEAWLEQHAHKSGWAAKQLTRAIAATGSPVVRQAFERGDLVVEQAAAVAPIVERVAKGSCPEAELVALVTAAVGQTVAGTKHAVATLITKLDEAEGKTAISHRSMTAHGTAHGTKIWRLELEPDAHAIVDNAVMAIVDEFWRAGHDKGTNPPTAELPRRRADAIVELARRSLAGGSSKGRGTAHAELLVVIDDDTLVGRVQGTGRLADGTPISGETARRIACDAGIIPVVMNGKSEVLDLGRSKRLASSAQRKALAARWCTCGFPGCTIPVRWTKAHHTDQWQPGGCTDIALLVPLCERHHHLVHEGGYRIERTEHGTYRFLRPDGTLHGETRPNGKAGP